MAVFMLNTDSVTSASESLNTISSEVKEIMSNVNSYDTSNDDDFDFDTAKSTIAANIEACATKISNTMNILKSVVSSHTNLQNGMKFESGEANPSDTGSSSSEGSSSWNDDGGAYGSGGSGGYGGSGGSGGGSGTTEPLPEEETDLLSTPLFKALIAAGLFSIVSEESLEDAIKDKATLVIKASQSGDKNKEYITLATEIAIANNIPVTFVDLDESGSLITTPSIYLVKNGEVLKTYRGYQSQETLEKMFEEYEETLNSTDTSEIDPNTTSSESENNIDSSTNSVVSGDIQSIVDDTMDDSYSDITENQTTQSNGVSSIIPQSSIDDSNIESESSLPDLNSNGSTLTL